MENIFFGVLLIGSFTSFSTAERGLFDFHDSQGRCWRCLPDSSCVRCPAGIASLENFPSNWDRTCQSPDFNVECQQFPGAKFPSLNINFYWICADDRVAIVQCFCDTVFDMRAQECVSVDNMTSIGCYSYDHADVMSCEAGSDPGEIPTLPPSGPPTAPTESPTELPTLPPTNPPTVPTDAPTDFPTNPPPTKPPITPPPPPNVPTITTEAGGPGVTNPGETTDESIDTTPAPCVCIVWWPCWCNPCWNMPCHSCSGCV